ncbi:MAG: YceK/YidQ family lipoprotein [Candidatus Electrothrix sp. AUS1_2]|nr:YceK/YidQ family lipoprotein [Candidatus Electrothrix sp. AUS1_2]
MKINLFFAKSIMLLICCVIISGCSSLATKETGFGAPYEGTAYIVDDLKCEKDDDLFPVYLSFPAGIIDTILSATLDTIFLPIDLVASPKEEIIPYKCKDLDLFKNVDFRDVVGH